MLNISTIHTNANALRFCKSKRRHKFVVDKIPARPAAAYASETSTIGQADVRAYSREGACGVSLGQGWIKISGEQDGILNYINYMTSQLCLSVLKLTD
jgi:hypothetical protein